MLSLLAVKKTKEPRRAPRLCLIAFALHELEEYYLSVVSLAGSKLEDPGVAALTVSVLRSDFLE